MSSSTEESSRLLDVLNECEKFVGSFGSISLMEPDKKEAYDSCLRKLEGLARQVDSLGLFSVNEHINEVSTGHLPFMYVTALLAECQYNTTDMHSRAEMLAGAQKHYTEYLERLKLYDALGESSQCLAASASSDPQQNRNIKIQRHKQKSALDERIADRRARCAAEPDDDEQLRALYLLKLQRYALQAVEHMNDINTELELLAFRKSQPPGAGLPPPQKRAQMPSMKPVILTRDAVQKQVFGAGYPSLPTMTVNEWFDQKMANDGFAQPLAEHFWGHPAAPVVDESREPTEDDEENERQKKIAMDEYTDTHRRGWGNTHNKG